MKSCARVEAGFEVAKVGASRLDNANRALMRGAEVCEMRGTGRANKFFYNIDHTG